MNLAPLDYILVCVPLIAVTIITITTRSSTKSVADFLAASRCAGRYLMSTASNQIGAAVLGLVVSMEVFSRTGFSIGFLSNFTAIFIFLFNLFGVVTFRFRETRCLTFHQFFELRYSKGMRVVASLIAFLSGLISFGLTPAVGARFFVYFCGMPETISLGGMIVPTFALIMVILMALSLFFVLVGGQITVMLTDAVEGLISSFFYLIVIFFVLAVVSFSQMKDVLLSGSPGKSYINPFDISGQQEFNGWYIALLFIFNIYVYRGSPNPAAKTAHESKMAGIVSAWRGYGLWAMLTLVSIGAFTVLHHPHFAAQRKAAMDELKNVGSPQLQEQMAMPAALGMLLGPGAKGAFCAIGLFGLLSSQGLSLFGLGATFMQDVILPLRKKPFTPKSHLFALRMAVFGVALFVCVFSLLYKPADYLQMVLILMGAIYLGGVGSVVWGGLYWKKGTTAGAWAAMITGTSLAVAFNILQPFWTTFQPLLLGVAGHGSFANYLIAHPDKCPIDGQEFSTGTAMCALLAYIVVSLLTCRKDFDMDQMLHRGKYAIVSEDDFREPLQKGFRWSKLIGIDEHFTKGDKVISTTTFFYTLCLKITSISVLTYWLLFGPQSDLWWFHFTIITSVCIPVFLALVTTVWLTIGTIRDIIQLFRNLRVARRDDADDGTVRNHHNLGERGLD